MSPFDFIDFTTPEGAKLGRMLSARCDELRSQLENPDLSERDTQLTRGALRELKTLMKKPAQRVTVPTYSFPGGSKP